MACHRGPGWAGVTERRVSEWSRCEGLQVYGCLVYHRIPGAEHGGPPCGCWKNGPLFGIRQMQQGKLRIGIQPDS